ncbi:MAG: peptide ABC transporter substrate-binding protein [Candidatus Rokubacteria bacterium]|nr:peptide ABC transporter substrate-binding protein [Candidatus Rokubacteria bacterium]
MSRHSRIALFLQTGLAVLLFLSMPVAAQTPRYGGILVTTPLSAPPSLSPHEEATIATVHAAIPCFNNLVYFDPMKKKESVDTIIAELAERWSWQDNYRNLVFFLRKSVKWHDGKPFTSADVKYTFDTVRGAPDAKGKLRVNPRKLWYANVEAIEAPDPHTVVFRLKHPQPSLLPMLASGYSPVYPAHVPVAEFKTKCVGTGPFKLKEYKPGEFLEFVRNPDYFVKGRPYLDGIKFIIIKDRSTQVAALEAGRLDVGPIGGWTKTNAETLKQNKPQLVVIRTSNNVNDNILVNFKRPPFTDARVRRAISLALDRKAYIQGPRQGDSTPGGGMLPKPEGLWGLPPTELAKLPGTGDPVKQKDEAKKLLAEAGFGPNNPLKVVVSTRALAIYVDVASWMVDQLKQAGIDATLEQIETGVWHPKMTRRDFQVALNLTGIGIDDPDANFAENYQCGSPRNYSDYCSEEIDKLIAEQSQILDRTKRLKLVNEIDKKLQLDGARPILGWNAQWTVMWPHVKNFVPHYGLYNWARMQEVWLDK